MNNLMLGRVVTQIYLTYPLYNELTDKEGDYLTDAIAITTYAYVTALNWAPIMKPTLIGAGVKASGRIALSAGASALQFTGRAVTVAAPFTAGYVIGATAGTAISGALFGEEGARTALGFYSGGMLPNTEAPTISTYGNLLKPSETSVPGPVELVGGFLQALNATRLKLPKFSNPTPTLTRY